MKIKIEWLNQKHVDMGLVNYDECHDVFEVSRQPDEHGLRDLILARFRDHDPHDIKSCRDYASSPLGERPLEHRVHSGTKFYCEQSDLSKPIYFVESDQHCSNAEWAKDVAEFIGWYSANIYPELYGGFQGYDNLEFKRKQ